MQNGGRRAAPSTATPPLHKETTCAGRQAGTATGSSETVRHSSKRGVARVLREDARQAGGRGRGPAGRPSCARGRCPQAETSSRHRSPSRPHRGRRSATCPSKPTASCADGSKSRPSSHSDCSPSGCILAPLLWPLETARRRPQGTASQPGRFRLVQQRSRACLRNCGPSAPSVSSPCAQRAQPKPHAAAAAAAAAVWGSHHRRVVRAPSMDYIWLWLWCIRHVGGGTPR